MATTIKPWADTPFKLIPTPGESDDVNTLSAIVWVAREMACAHNGMLRGLNSVYQQCIFVHEAKDIEDLLLYTKFWCDWIDEHHEGEETIFFPQVEIVTGVEGLMAKNVAQHHAFLPGLQKLKKYTSETKAGNYTGEELRRVVDEFGAMLTRHLTEEIATLLDLEAYDAKALKVAYVEFDEAMRQGEKSILYPLVMGTSDVDFEGANDWPPVPFFVRYFIHYWFERTYQGVWRFSPSTTWGKKRALMFAGNS